MCVPTVSEETSLDLEDISSLKGGDPSTASATDALLRLSPCYWSYLSTLAGLSDITNSLDLTGGEYKTRERIQRAEADARLLAIPASRGRIAARDLNWGVV